MGNPVNQYQNVNGECIDVIRPISRSSNPLSPDLKLGPGHRSGPDLLVYYDTRLYLISLLILSNFKPLYYFLLK